MTFKVIEYDNDFNKIDEWETESNNEEGNYHPTLGALRHTLDRRSSLYSIWFGGKRIAATVDPDRAYTCDTCDLTTHDSSFCDHCNRVHCGDHDCGNTECNMNCIHHDIHNPTCPRGRDAGPCDCK